MTRVTGLPKPAEGEVFVIAEAGVNHNGDVALAKQMIDAAADAHADAVKFQTWQAGEITGRFTVKVDYLKDSTPDDETRYELSDRLRLDKDAFRKLSTYADGIGILFLSTPDGFESLDFLVDELDVPYIKVGSTEVTHLQFLEAVGRKQRPVIFSTGLSTLEEVGLGIDALRRGGAAPLTLLHCTSEYPAPPEEINLRAMRTLSETFDLPVGLSDHSQGSEAAIAAVALGARVIEKHFTLDRELEGPDHAASLDPAELAEMIAAIRTTERMLGDGIKRPTPSERRNMDGIRRSVVAARQLSAGIQLTANDLTCKRPGHGIQPVDLESLVGRILTRDLEPDEPLHWDDME